MSNFDLVEAKDDDGNRWTLADLRDGTFVELYSYVVPMDSDIQWKIVGGEPPSQEYPDGIVHAVHISGNGDAHDSVSKHPEFFNYKWKRL